ncbi:hypothetical protein CHUAL_000355 [Chamberlinius hualienensis]
MDFGPEDDRYAASFNEIQAQKEVLQRRHYFLLGELQTMTKELPPKYQQRFPNELLSDIAKALLDGSLYDIVMGLKDIQLMTEKNLFSQRLKVVNSQKLELQDLIKKMKSPESSGKQDEFTKQKIIMQKRQQEEIRRMDMKLIMELDQKVSDQQVTLEKAGVPGFFVTNNPTEIRLQMYILDFVQRLNAVQLPS